MHKFLKINNISSDVILEDKKTNKLSIAIQTVDSVDVNLLTIDSELNETFLSEPQNGQFTIFGDLSDEHMLFTDTIANAITLNTCTKLTAVACYDKNNISNVINSFTHFIKPVACVDHMDLDDFLEFEGEVLDTTNARIVMCDEKAKSFVRMRKLGNDLSVLKAVNVAVDAIKDENKPKINWVCADDLGEIKGTDWLIDELLETVGLSNLFGPTGHCKSFVLDEMLFCIAAGIDYNGQEVQQRPVQMIVGEGMDGVNARIKALRVKYSYEGHLPLYITNDLIQMIDEGTADKIIESTKQLEEHIGKKIGAIGIDTLNRCFGDGDENNTQDMTKFTNACIEVKKALNTSVIIVHHTPDASPRKARGNGSLKASLESEINILKPESKEGVPYGYVEVNSTKQKNGKEIDPLFFIPEVIDLGKDSKGRDVTTLVMNKISPDEASEIRSSIDVNSVKKFTRKIPEAKTSNQKKEDIKAKAIVNKSKIEKSVENIINSQNKSIEVKKVDVRESVIAHIKSNNNKIELSSLKSFCELNELDLTESKLVLKDLQKENKISINKTTLTLL